MPQPPKPPPRSEVVRVRVTPDQREALRRMAAEDGATESELIRRLVAEEARRRAGGGRGAKPRPRRR